MNVDGEWFFSRENINVQEILFPGNKEINIQPDDIRTRKYKFDGRTCMCVYDP